MLSGNSLSREDPWRGEPLAERWHSFDRTPWRHPWLTEANLGAERRYSAEVYRWARRQAGATDPRQFRFAAVGNMANGMYLRAAPLRRSGLSIDVVLHPQDRFLMSQPGWEEFAGELSAQADTVDDLVRAGITLPHVAGVRDAPLRPDWYVDPDNVRPAFLDPDTEERFTAYLPFVGTLEALQDYDALLTTQTQYLAWLARRPYLVTQSGGDIWYEASRADLHGWIQRAAFADAAAFLVSNPWSYAHARRFGWHNFVYVPLIFDETVYCPGPPRFREEWRQAVGGSFFVLTTARLDRLFKGSDKALDGFARFARDFPEARLVSIGWGTDRQALMHELHQRGIADRVHVVPVSGKRRVIEYLRSADCLLDQFILGYYGATAIEAMGCGLPVVMRLERAQYEALLPAGAPPTLDASTPDEIAVRLAALAAAPEGLRRAREQARSWFLEAHASARWAGIYTDLLVATALGHRFPFRASPLRQPLSEAERAYHAAELAGAPAFPNYV
jgi:glycosyltransferase involved in cell wall biosynthesis